MDAFAAHQGEEIDTQGDSFFVAFRSASDAVAAAIAIQRSLADHEWPDKAKVRKTHPHAVRILARTWIAVIWRCWQNQLAYDPDRHRAITALTDVQSAVAASRAASSVPRRHHLPQFRACDV
jgi:hypothetical protein